MSSLEIPRSGITSSILVNIYLPPISFLESLYQRASHHQWLSVIISFCHQFLSICKNKTEHETWRCQCVQFLPIFVLHSTPDSGWPRFKSPWDSPGKNTEVGCHCLLQCMKVKSESEVTQSCPTLSDPMDCSLPGSSVHGICQARVLEWGAIAFSKV